MGQYALFFRFNGAYFSALYRMFTLVMEQKSISRITRYYTDEFVAAKNLYNFNCTLF